MRDPGDVGCSVEGCGEPATYKVAAPWRGGSFAELKTYGFACDDHVRPVLADAEARWLDYEPTKDEVVGYVHVYRFEPGRGDRGLVPDADLEDELRSY